jgi:hypothetical protein
MTRWHRLHPYFKSLPSTEAKISLAINGSSNIPYDYPDIGQRFKRYIGWLKEPTVLALKFEDLVSEKRKNSVARIIDFYCHYSAQDPKGLLQRALDNIDPYRSHTFRQGKSGGWRNTLTETHKEQIKIVAGQLLVDLGYENDLNW